MVPTTCIVLSGGRARRLGEPKSTADLHGRSALRVLLDGLPSDLPVIVVGDGAPDIKRPVVLLREDPPHAGPLHALATALRSNLHTPAFILLAVDLPLAGAHCLPLVDLLGVATGTPAPQAVIPVDASGRAQPLAAAFATEAVRERVETLDGTINRPISLLLDHLDVFTVQLGSDDPRAADFSDFDTQQELDQLRTRLADRG